MELIFITVGAIMALAATLVLAVWRTIARPTSSERFDDALKLIASNQEANIDTTLTKTAKKEGKWSWSRFWYDTIIKTGRIVNDPQGPGRFMAGLAAVALFFGIAIYPGGTQGIFAPVFALGMAYLWFNTEQGKRRRTMEKQLPLLLSGIRVQMSAGLTPQAAIIAVADDLPSPIGDEIRQLKADVSVSVPLEQALTALASRMKSRIMFFLVSSIGIAIRSGSDLVPQLITIEEIVRQRARIDGKLRAALALARPTSYLAMGVPALMTMYFFTSDPSYAAFFFGEGIIMGMVALAMYVIGIIVIRAMISKVEKIV